MRSWTPYQGSASPKALRQYEIHVFSADPAYPSERLPPWVKFHSVAGRSWFSAAKLLGLLQLYGTTASEPLLLTADDDQLYESTWVETLLSQQAAVPAARAGVGCAAGGSGREADGFEYGVARPKSDGVWGSFPAVATYVVLGSQLARPWQVGVATGGCGVCCAPISSTTPSSGHCQGAEWDPRRGRRLDERNVGTPQ